MEAWEGQGGAVMMGILGKEGLNLAKASFQDNLEKKRARAVCGKSSQPPSSRAETPLGAARRPMRLGLSQSLSERMPGCGDHGKQRRVCA